jgi:hypothetical protein
MRGRYDVVEDVSGNDVLFFHKANIERQRDEVGTFSVQFMDDSGGLSIGRSFKPTWSTEHVPTAVRVTGIVRLPGGGRETRTVEAEITEPAALARRGRLLSKAARTTDIAAKAELVAEAQAIGSTINITTNRALVTAGKRKKGRTGKTGSDANAGQVLVEVLANQRTPGKVFDPAKGTKVQTLRREVVSGTMVAASADELENFARAWLASRLDLHIRGSFGITNVVGSELLYPGQIHQFSGLPTEYAGPYMMRTMTHEWAGTGHSVEGEAQKIAFNPTSTVAR